MKIIKKSAIRHLTNAKDPTSELPTRKLQKTDPEFKDLFGYVYRGVAFALVSLYLFLSIS